ncbi:MAG: L,D-transpeptidase [Armatimonadetes bacterium]|nr:L,D-transpeptidase [Armatimonadota bacterium]
MAHRLAWLSGLSLWCSVCLAQSRAQEIPVVSAAPSVASEPALSLAPADLVIVDAPAPRPPVAPPVHDLAFQSLPSEVVEGRSTTLAWAAGPGIVSTEVLAWAEGVTRGGQQIYGKVVVVRPTERSGSGSVDWVPPGLDCIGLTLKVKGYNSDGKVCATAAKWLRYRPADLANQRADGIFVRLSDHEQQRMYLQKDGLLVRYFVCSGGSPGGGGHDHFGEFRIYAKSVDHYSSLNSAWRMRYAMHYYQGHAIHATAPQYYDALGAAASHGCIRLHLVDARDLYGLVALRAPVTVF